MTRDALAAKVSLHEVLARIDDGFLALDAGQRYTYVNRRAAQMLGRERQDDLLGRHIWTEFPQIVGSSFQRAFDAAMSTQQPAVVEEYFAPVGRWFEGRLFPSPEGMSIYFSDITLRKQAEKTLRVSELRYRLAATGGQVWDWDAISGEVKFPAPFWQLLGRAPPRVQDVIASFEALLHPEDLPRWRQTLREHLARRAPYELEFRARHADGEWRWFHTQGQAMWDTRGRATYMAGTTFDITERKAAEAALRESEAYRRNLFDQLADGVLLLDREHRILDANPQALAMLGWRRDELLQRRLHDLLADFERPRLDREVPEMMAGQPHLAEWEHVRKDGSRFPAEVSARRLDERRYLAVVRDITLRRESERAMLGYQLELSELTQRLLSQEKTTTQRVAQALHDHLGQTLAVARLNLDACVATHGAAMPGPMREQTARIATLLEQAVREVRQVLADLRPPLLEDQGLAAALDNEIASRAVAGGGTDVLLELADGAPARRWPADVEYGAFMVAREALANALQHAGASLIRVVLGGEEGELKLEVIDDGNGIPAPLLRGRPGHLGIVGMRERAIAIGAHFSVEKMPAGGTRMTLHWRARKS
ncbi:MAG: PAS domain S-box protein [Rubrivivax sp.]|nr:PAS domain S-box protein [Rubrivivax sp.]